MDISLRAAIEPFPSGQCPTDVNDLLRHIEEKIRITSTLDSQGAGVSIGPTEPGVDDRDRVWMKTDSSSGTFIGLFAWNSNFGMWERAGGIGERITRIRSEGTLEADRRKYGVDGPWKLADGTTPGVPNLTDSTNGPFFAGTAPEWDTYTVIKTGSP